MNRKDFKALYRAFHKINALCLEAYEKKEQSEDDYEYREMMGWRLDGLLDARTILITILTTKNKK
jgi:hypothetical protein